MLRPDSPDVHYNNVTRAWQYLLGQDLHYGYFDAPDQPLEQGTAALTSLMMDRAQLGADSKVLDVGCGIGTPALAMAERFGCSVTGISTSEVGLGLAGARAAERGLSDRVRFALRDGMSNDFPSEHFDRVWVMESSHLMPDKAALARECARVLTPGGRLVLCDIISHRPIPLGEVLRHAKAFDTLRRAFGRAKMETMESYRRWFTDAGLRVDALEDISEPTLPTFDHWAANAAKHEAEVVALIGQEAFDDFVDSCAILRTFWVDRVLGYGLVSACKDS